MTYSTNVIPSQLEVSLSRVGAQGSKGDPGPTGPNGWSAEWAIEFYDGKKLIKVVDWFGGEGDKPAVDVYLAEGGFTGNRNLAIDVSGGVGPQGDPGPEGPSAYEVAVSDGFVGDETAWLLSLTGPKGDTGDVGPEGPDGPSAYDVAVADGFVGTEAEWLATLVGPQGDTGDKGDKGDTGDIGLTGASAYEAAVAGGFVGTEAEWLSSLVGPQGDLGWSPVFAIISDGERRVLQVSDWVGGEGTKPAVGDYIGATGLVSVIADAVDIRGPQGTPGLDGTGAGDMVAATYDPQSVVADVFDRANHTGTQAIGTIDGLQLVLDDTLSTGDVGATVQAHSAILDGTTASFTTELSTKLSTIEDNADVTDTANVAAAGALMESEVVNLADVKSFDPADYATAAQGVLADSSLQPAAIGTTVQAYDVNLDNINQGLATTDDVVFNTVQLSGGTGDQGTVAWDVDAETLSVVENGKTLLVGQEALWHVRNNSGSIIPIGTPVMATGTIGASGRITVAPMDGTNPANAKFLLGVTSEELGIDADGKVTHFGKVRGLDTSAYAEGTTLYISTTAAGEFTTVAPTSGLSLALAFVVTSHAANGLLAVRVNTIDTNSFATAAQGTLAETAVQPEDTTNWDTAYSWGDHSLAGYATETYVGAAVSALVDTAPATLDTLNELAAALGDDPNFATTVSAQISTKLDASAYTAADVLSKLLTVDGTGSGVDADLLDGLQATEFATAAQGALANSAVQPADLSVVATSGVYGDLSGLPTLGTAAATASTDYATAAQGALADSAVQPGDDADTLGSGDATDGWVLTADGAGGAAWEAASGGGDLVVETSSGASQSVDFSTSNKIHVATIDEHATLAFTNPASVAKLDLILDVQSSPYVISAASYDSLSFLANAQDSVPVNFFLGANGTKLYIAGAASNTLYQYSLSTAWDVNTASYDSVSFNYSASAAGLRAISFKSDGTKMYLVGLTGVSVYQYSLSTAWDLSTAAYDNVSFSVSAQMAQPSDVHFKPDGTKMYVPDTLGDTIYQYSLSTAWDLSTASYDSVSFSVASQETSLRAIEIDADGGKLFAMGQANDTIYQYSLSIGWDLSTASYDSVSFSFASQDGNPVGLQFKSDGAKMYVFGLTTNRIHQYTAEGAPSVTLPANLEAPTVPIAANQKTTLQVATYDGGTTYQATLVSESGNLAVLGVTETADASSATTYALDPTTNGTRATMTLTAATALTDSLSDGEHISLRVLNGDTHTVTWVSGTLWVGGSAPTLTGDDRVTFEKWGTDLIGYVGLGIA